MYYNIYTYILLYNISNIYFQPIHFYYRYRRVFPDDCCIVYVEVNNIEKDLGLYLDLWVKVPVYAEPGFVYCRAPLPQDRVPTCTTTNCYRPKAGQPGYVYADASRNSAGRDRNPGPTQVTNLAAASASSGAWSDVD
jgi:hypothetical protein